MEVGVGRRVFGSPAADRRGLSIPRCCLPPPLIQKRFISDISQVETETLNLILDPPKVTYLTF